MPIGNVRLREFAGAVVDRIVDQVTEFGNVKLLEADPEDLDALRKGMGRNQGICRVCYDPQASISLEPGMNRTQLWEFGLIITVLFRKIGSSTVRLGDGTETDVSTLTKATMDALQGERLSILNQGGIECGPVGFLVTGDSLQALQFRVTGKSRESRS